MNSTTSNFLYARGFTMSVSGKIENIGIAKAHYAPLDFRDVGEKRR